MKKKIPSGKLFSISLGIGVVFAILYFFPFWHDTEYRMYDTFLAVKPSVKEDKSIVLLDIDEQSIDKIGSYPWPRGVIANGLEALAELEASYVVFDIEYINNSPMSVDTTYLGGTLKSSFNTSFEEIGSNLQDVFTALVNRQIDIAQVNEYGRELISLIDMSRENLYKKTELVAIENDSYLGKAMRLFGSSYVTINMQPYEVQDSFRERYSLVKEQFIYPKIKIESIYPSSTVAGLVPIPEISTMASSAGFTNVPIDGDGVRRRIRLVDIIGDTPFLQLAFSPLLRKIGSPEVIVNSRSIQLKNAVLDGKTQNINIPLDSNGMMLIRWPKENYQESFTHVPFWLLLSYRDNSSMMASHLRLLRSNQGWGLGPGLAPVDACIAAWEESERLRNIALNEGSNQAKQDWLAAKSTYWKTVSAFLNLGYDTTVPQLFDNAKAADVPENASLYDQIKDDFKKLYTNVDVSYKNHISLEKELSTRLKDAYCIVGWTSTGTTDIGVNPFHSEYVNVGTHAAVANTIIQKDFIIEAPFWLSALLAIVFALAVIFITASLNNIVSQTTIGLAVTLAILIMDYLVFYFSGIYIPIVSPVLATFISFLVYSLLSFILSEREKSFLRKAFGTYMSGDVINELIANPDMLKLGGQKKWITAMFTDVRGFSSVSEVLDAEQLVKLLNIYLSGMSDIVLEERGTIDKYEGDAIIAFFGAPIDYKEHATLACRSAIFMKRKEAELNVSFAESKMSPNPLLTRIGINTGDMVVGNMGTQRKMDYTIMGNAVNLAARLEGVNKQYGSWILISDATYKETGDEFLVRRFDLVRVVGIHTPVQLWELVDIKTDAKQEAFDIVGEFEEAHKTFDQRDFKTAKAMFEKIALTHTTDGPTQTYIRKCDNFIKNPPQPDWDGVFSLTEK